MAQGDGTPCPLCDGMAFAWLSLPAPDSGATVGMLSPVDPDAPEQPAGTVMIDRCDNCGTGIARSPDPVDLSLELAAVSVPGSDDTLQIDAPNRASIQAGIGGEGWAALDVWRGRLLLTPKGLERLAEKQGLELDRVRQRIWGPSQAWMWQTLMNGLTVHPNFAREVRAGRLRPANARSRFAFWADSVATVLAAPLVALVSFPLELVAVAMRRGGEMLAVARR